MKNDVWKQCIEHLEGELPAQQFNTWIRPLQAVYDGNVLKLLAPNRFVVDWIKNKYINSISQIVNGLNGDQPCAVEICVGSTASPPTNTTPPCQEMAPRGWGKRKSARITADFPPVSIHNIPSKLSLKANPINWPGLPPCKSPRTPGLPTIHCSSAAVWVWAKPTSCTPLAMPYSRPDRRLAWSTYDPSGLSQTWSRPCSTMPSMTSSAITGPWMRSSSMIFSSLRARSAPRRNFSILSIRCLKANSKSSSLVIAIPRKLRVLRNVSNHDSAGG